MAPLVCMFFAFFFSFSKNNQHWNIAAPLANTNYFVLLRFRLIGWLKCPTTTNALLYTGTLRWTHLMFSCSHAVRKGQDLRLKQRTAELRLITKNNPVMCEYPMFFLLNSSVFHHGFHVITVRHSGCQLFVELLNSYRARRWDSLIEYEFQKSSMPFLTVITL